MQPLTGHNRWLFQPVLRPGARQRLFVFPCAGGNPASYRDWCVAVAETTEIIPVRLPGRGMRLYEPVFSEMPALVEAVHDGISTHLDLPFAFVGHSMGTLLAFELSRLLRRKGQSEPTGLIAMGHRAPDVSLRRQPICGLPKDEFWREVRRLGGTPEEAFESPELLELVAPTLRADLSVCELYRYVAEGALAVPIAAYWGSADASTSSEEVRAWATHTKSPFVFRSFEGGHFFPQTLSQDVLLAVQQDAHLPLPL